VIRALLIATFVVVAVLAINTFRQQDSAARRRSWRWVVGIAIAALLAVVLFRTGFHWLGVAAVAAFGLMRRFSPLLWRLFPFAHRAWKRRSGTTSDPKTVGPDRTVPQTMTEAEALQVLGLKPGASPEQISHAYRQLMRKVHPDRPGGSGDLASRVNQARQVLLG
jgi:hypothetical protein